MTEARRGTGLRLRLVLGAVLVAATAILIVAIGASRAVRLELEQLVDREAAPVDGLDAALDAAVAGLRADRGGDAGEILRRAAGDPPRAVLLLLDASGATLAASDATWRDARAIDSEAGQLVVEREVDDGAGRREERLVLGGAPSAVIAATDGAGPRRLLSLPPPAEGEEDESADGGAGTAVALRSIDRRLLFAAALAIGVAAALAVLVARRIVGPLTSLTDAARAMARGDTATRVDVRGHDELARLARAFNTMAETVERQESLRRRMVADVAHELRTPLTALRCQLESAQDGLVHADRSLIDSLHRDALTLGRLVDDLQDLALLEAGRLSMHPEPLRLDGEVRAACRAAEAARPAPRATIEVDCDAAVQVVVDRHRLRQVLTNLVANALVHTPADGRVVVAARDEGELVVVEVADDGPGIPETDLPHVFERFYRADPARARDGGGAGLGLAVCRRLVRAWGGEIDARNAEDGGASLRFTIPDCGSHRPEATG